MRVGSLRRTCQVIDVSREGSSHSRRYSFVDPNTHRYSVQDSNPMVTGPSGVNLCAKISHHVDSDGLQMCEVQLNSRYYPSQCCLPRALKLKDLCIITKGWPKCLARNPDTNVFFLRSTCNGQDTYMMSHMSGQVSTNPTQDSSAKSV